MNGNEELDFEISHGILYSYDGKDEKVTIPKGVCVIGQKAFEDNLLVHEVIIPEGVIEIEKLAFCGCSGLERIELPSTVTKISDDAFDIAGDLKTIDVNDANPVFSSVDGVLYSKDKETIIKVPTGLEWEFNIPHNVKRIESRCFEYCDKIERITVPSSVEEIGPSAFGNTSDLYELIVDENNKNFTSIHNIIYSKDVTKLIAASGGLSGLINVPNTVISIEDNAFEGCESIDRIRVPNSVITIGKEAFTYCFDLIAVKISDSVMEIGEDAFVGCFFLENITVDKHNKYYASVDGVLYDKDIETLIYVPNSTPKTIKIPNTVKYIGASSFEDCADITKIRIPNSVESIDGLAFMNCGDLKSIKLGKKLKSIWCSAFYNCTSLKEVVIPNSVEFIENGAFENCTDLKKVVIGKGVKSIGDRAFSGCESLSSITIPNNVTEIGECVFCSASCNLEKITVPRHLKDYFTSESFKDENPNCKVIVK